jgi:hypothetical protein
LFVTCDGDDVLQKFALGRIMASHKDVFVDSLGLPKGSRPVSPVVSSDGSTVWVALSSPGRVVAVDVDSMRMTSTVELGVDAVTKLVVDRSTGRWWALGSNRVVRVEDERVTGSFDAPAGSSGLDVGPSGDVFVCAPSGDVVQRDGATGDVVASTRVEGTPVACAVNPISSRVWLACRDGFARGLDPKTLEHVRTSEEIAGLTDLAVDVVGRTVYGSMDATPPQPTFVYFDDDTGVIFDRARLDPESRCPSITLSSDSFMYLPLEDVDKVWVFHGGTFWVRAASPFWCEHGSLIAEGATSLPLA